jgi:hypothetical protein
MPTNSFTAASAPAALEMICPEAKKPLHPALKYLRNI